MTALVRYTVAVLLHTQHYLAPVLLYAGFLAVATMNGYGPLPPVYASSAGALFVCTVWLTVVVLSLDTPEQRAIVVVSAGRSGTVLVAAVITTFLACVPLAVLGLVFPLWTGTYDVTAADLALGAVAELACACTGVAVGVLCSRLVIPRQGHALVAALALIGVFLFSEVPPVHPLIQAMSTGSAGMFALAGGMLGVAVAFLVVAVPVAQFVSSRGSHKG